MGWSMLRLFSFVFFILTALLYAIILFSFSLSVLTHGGINTLRDGKIR